MIGYLDTLGDTGLVSRHWLSQFEGILLVRNVKICIHEYIYIYTYACMYMYIHFKVRGRPRLQRPCVQNACPGILICLSQEFLKPGQREEERVSFSFWALEGELKSTEWEEKVEGG